MNAAPRTINTGNVNSYIVQKTIGGWVVCWLNEDRSIRNIDGGKVHKSRQNAYHRAKRLNGALKLALEKYDMAEAEYGSGYIANVTEGDYPGDYQEYKHQYSLTLRQGMMPPFETRFFDSLEELEQHTKSTLPQPLNWHVVKPEEI